MAARVRFGTLILAGGNDGEPEALHDLPRLAGGVSDGVPYSSAPPGGNCLASAVLLAASRAVPAMNTFRFVLWLWRIGLLLRERRKAEKDGANCVAN